MNKNILIGISGGIACYKIPTLISLLTKKGYTIDVIMTKNATEFITPLTISTISKSKVVFDMFKQDFSCDVEHISLAKKADVILIAPATANIIGKIANGIADDMLTTTVMASTKQVIFAPAMNDNMYNNKIVQNNIKKLKEYGYKFIEPKVGNLACGTFSVEKLADTETIIDFVEKEF